MSSNIFKFLLSIYIDDIYLLWNESEIQLLDFITRLSSRQPQKIDFKYSQSILDTKIYQSK